MKLKCLNILLIFLSLASVSKINSIDTKDPLQTRFCSSVEAECGQVETQEELNKCLEKFYNLKQKIQTNKADLKLYYEKVVEKKLKKQEEKYERKLSDKDKKICDKEKRIEKATWSAFVLKGLGGAAAGGAAGSGAYIFLACAAGPAGILGGGVFGATVYALDRCFPH